MTVPATILIVEDNPTTRKMLRLVLETEGYRIVEAGDARAALAAVHERMPDLILQDLILPDMDGLELLRRLRAQAGGTEVPILALSGFLGRLEESQTADAGFTARLVKPIEPGQLVESIRAYLPLPEPSAAVGQGRRLLIVDDDPVQLKLARLHFGLRGFSVTAAGSAAEALAAARSQRPDVILSDVFMPDNDGFQFCLDLRRDRDLAQVPLVLVSSQYQSTEDRHLATRVGANALVLRTPDLAEALQAISRALGAPPPPAVEAPTDQLRLHHAQLVIEQFERQSKSHAGLAQRCALQAAQLSLLSGVADALTHQTDPDIALRDVLAATLDAAGISKGALMLRDAVEQLEVRQAIGFSETEREALQTFFGQRALLDTIVDRLASVSVPSAEIPAPVAQAMLSDAGVATMHIVPLLSGGRGVGVMIIGATRTDVTSGDSVAFARAMGHQIVQSIELARAIGDQRRAEQAARAECDRAQRYLDTADVILLALDMKAHIVLINRKGCELLGWSESELLGRSWIEICVPERIRQGLTERFANLFGGDLSLVENPILTRDGRERLIEWRTRVLRDEAGRATGTFSSGADITERHEALEALRTAEERMRFALESADVGIWDMDYTSGVVRWSEIAERHHGLQPGAFGGTFEAFVECVHPDDRTPLRETVEKAMKTGSDFSTHNRSVRPDGTVRWISGAGRILLGQDGQPVRGVGISLDVTERRTLEEQYHQAQKMEAVGQLAGGVAHDFNNVLTAILGFTDLIASGMPEDDPVQQDLLEIKKAGEHAAGLTRQLLAFSRKQIVQPRVLNVSAVLAGLKPMLERLLREDVNLAVSLASTADSVKIDPVQLEQIMVNLVVNASDAMPRGGRLTIETTSVTLDEHFLQGHLPVTPGEYVLLAVSDTGTGMDAATVARIFEPFFTTKSAGKGTGLGLATVYGIVKQNDGNIWVDSVPGSGSTFRIYLPQVTMARVAATNPASASGAMPSGTETILLVEDDNAVRRMARVTLTRAGYRVIEAGNPKEAVQIARGLEGRIHLLLSDVIMPESEGAPLFEQLALLQPGVRVLYMSGYADEAVIRHGVLVDGVPFLSKPFTPMVLAQTVREVLDAPRGEPAAGLSAVS